MNLDDWQNLWESPPEGPCEFCATPAVMWAFDDGAPLCTVCAQLRGARKLAEEGFRPDWSYGYPGWTCAYLQACVACDGDLTPLRTPIAWVDAFVAEEPHVATEYDLSNGIPLHKECFRRSPFRWLKKNPQRS